MFCWGKWRKDGQTHKRTDNIPSSRAPVGAKNLKFFFNLKILSLRPCRGLLPLPLDITHTYSLFVSVIWWTCTTNWQMLPRQMSEHLPSTPPYALQDTDSSFLSGILQAFFFQNHRIITFRRAPLQLRVNGTASRLLMCSFKDDS